MASTPDISTLCTVLAATLNPDAGARQAGEGVLKNASLTPDFLTHLVQIISDNVVDLPIRTSAAVLLKNEVRRHWEGPLGAGVREGGVYSDEAKVKVRKCVIPLVEVTIGIKALSNTVLDAVRYIIYTDFPEKWQDALRQCIVRLQQRANVPALRAALHVVRLIVKKYEFRVSQGQDIIAEIVTSVFPLLLSLAGDVAKEGCFGNEVSAEIVKLMCKIYWSSTQAASSGDSIIHTLDDWMGFMKYLLETPVPEAVLSSVPDSETRAALQQFKAKKWAAQNVNRFLARYGTPAFLEKSKEGKVADRLVGTQFMDKWSGQFLEVFLHQLQSHSWISDRLLSLMLQYFCQCLESAVTYKVLKPRVEFLLFEICFPKLCYSSEDVEAWELDPHDFVRGHGFTVRGGPRDCAVEFIQSVARLRGRDFFNSLTEFVQRVLIEHSSATPDKQFEMDRKKDGALLMIGSIADRLTSKKRQLQIEPFLTQFVLPELTNTKNPFLRLRACWTYRQFIDSERVASEFKNREKLFEAFVLTMNLCSDSELPVRVEAAISLRGYFETEEEDLKAKMASRIPQIMERLFAIMAQVQDNELVVATMESLVLNFEEQIPPYAVELVTCLSNALIKMIDVANGTTQVEGSPNSVASSIGLDEEDSALTAMSVAQAISSVMSTLVDPKFQPLFDQIAPALVPLLNKILSPEGIDYIDDGLVLLTYLSFYCSNLSTPTDLWMYFERLYQMVCGGTSSHLTLEGVCSGGWAPDYLDKMLPPLDNYMSRDSERFARGISSIEAKPYKQLALDMSKKCLTQTVDQEGPQYALELLMLLFEGAMGKAPMVDDVMAPTLELLFQYLKTLEDPSSNRTVVSLSVRLLSMMVIYNSKLFIQLCESANLTGQAFEVFAMVNTVRAREGKKAVVLAFATLLDMLAKNELPPNLQNMSADMAKAVAVEMRALVDLKRKQDEASSEEASDSDGDSEQDIDENEDAAQATQLLLEKIAQSAAEDEDDDDDDSYFDPEAATDGFPVRDSQIDKINELEVVLSLLTRMAPLFQQAIGTTDLQLFKEFLTNEEARRRLVASS